LLQLLILQPQETTVSGSPAPKYFVTGGAGFIGAHLVNHLLDSTSSSVTVLDNFSTGRRWAFGDRVGDPRLVIINGDAQDQAALVHAIASHDTVYHFAANSDIARAATKPAIDFLNGTLLTHNVLEAMRETGVRRILFSSGSGVYGDVPPIPIPEEYPRMIPISTYGACKLASESLISAYCHMFGITGTVLRFANVVGPHQTHGVAYDFLRRLAKDSTRLKIFGDGRQTKPYIHIDDVLTAFRLMERDQMESYDVFNVGTNDSLMVNEVADIVIERMGLAGVAYEFTGGTRGWKADVPVYKLDTQKIRSCGWSSHRNSREAVIAAVDSMIWDLKAGNIKPEA
jgi:UDP-glucose 4-epimerase